MPRTVLLVGVNAGIGIKGTPTPVYTGVPYSYTLQVIGTSAKVTIAETGTLPTGLTFTDNGNGTATLAGTVAAAAAGSYPITVTVTPAGGTAIPFTYTLLVPALVLQYTQPTTITRGIAIAATAGVRAYADGGSGAGYVYGATGIPDRPLYQYIHRSALTGTITAAVGTYTVTFNVTDSASNTASIVAARQVVRSRLTAGNVSPNRSFARVQRAPIIN
jgi:hypothetical protein